MNDLTKNDEERFIDEEKEWAPSGIKPAQTHDLVKNDEERFVDEEEDWVEGENPAERDIVSVATDQIRELRKGLPDTSRTAAAIDGNAPWMEISQCAEEEGFHQIANLLFEAEQQGLED